MTRTNESREETLTQVIGLREKYMEQQLQIDIKNHHKLRLGLTLAQAATLPKYRGIQSFFVDNQLNGLKQNFYVASKLLMASQLNADTAWDVFADYAPFLYGLLSDSPEVFDWLTRAELNRSNDVRAPHFSFYQWQLALRADDLSLKKTIESVAEKGSRRNSPLAKSGQDFFSLLLKEDQTGLQKIIENFAKISSANELEGRFLAGFAIIHAKICWRRDIKVKVSNPLVPMDLLPIQPLENYVAEYDYLSPGWTPPKPPKLLAIIKDLFF